MIRQITIGIIYIIVLVIMILTDIEKLEEFFYIFHRKVIIVIGILLGGKELYVSLRNVLSGKGQRLMINDNNNILYRLIAGIVIFLFLFAIDSYIMDKVVKSKLERLEIVLPTNGTDISNLITDVEVNVRAVEDKSVYIIVETPQSAMWVQEKLSSRKFKDTLPGRARLGEGNTGIGETFKIFAIATADDLPIGILNKVPQDAIYSKAVTVRRIQ